MRAGELAAPYPTVDLSTPVIDAARLMAAENLPGLIVVDGDRPVTILPGTQVLQLAVPGYCQDDPALARVIDERSADLFVRNLGDRTVAEALPQEHRDLPVLEPDATVLEIAAVMARSRSPLVAIAEHNGPLLGVITLDALLERVLA